MGRPGIVTVLALAVVEELVAKELVMDARVVALADVKTAAMGGAPDVLVVVPIFVLDVLLDVPVGAEAVVRGLVRILALDALIRVSHNVGVLVRLVAGELLSNI